MSVPAEQPRRIPCPIAFVGEAPGDEEMAGGRPLIGPSGRIYNGLLRTAGLDRKDHWTGNVFDTQLPDNEVGNWCAQTKEAREGGFADHPPIGGAGYLRPAYWPHLDRLARELQAVQPRVIVPLGGTALWAFTGNAAIGKARGAVDQARYIMPGAKLLPTFHPAHVMRQWKFYTVVAGDFIKAAAEAARGPEIHYPKRKLLLAPTLEDIRGFIDEWLIPADLISVDIETAFGQITCIGFAPSAERAMVVPFVDMRRPNRCYWPTPKMERKAWDMVREVLEGPVPKLGQNFQAYDMYWLLAKYGIRVMNLTDDTRLMHHALYPELPKDLGFMGASYTEQGPWKTMRSFRPDKRDE